VSEFLFGNDAHAGLSVSRVSRVLDSPLDFAQRQWSLTDASKHWQTEREREREKFIYNEIEYSRSVSTTPLAGDTASGRSWPSIWREREKFIDNQEVTEGK
jgi:hypothetical protein